MSHTLTDWKFAGPVTATRYPNMYLQHRHRHWRILATDDLGDVDATGPLYLTMGEAFADLDRVHAVFYWTEEDAEMVSDEAPPKLERKPAFPPIPPVIRLLLIFLGFALATALAALPGPIVAHASVPTVHVTLRGLDGKVAQLARYEYQLPASSAVCWPTGPRIFSCQVFGHDHFRAIATGQIGTAGRVSAVFS